MVARRTSFLFCFGWARVLYSASLTTNLLEQNSVFVVSNLAVLISTFLVLSLLAPAVPLPSGGGPVDTSFIRQNHRRLTFQFDQRYSLVDSRLAGINGLKLGVEWRGRYRAGGGLYLLSPGVRAYSRHPAIPVGTPAEIRFRYAAIYGEYVIRGNPRWEISTPVQVGLGRYYHQYTDDGAVTQRTARDRVFLIEPTIGGHYRIFRWVGVGGGVGWREALSVKNQYGDELDGPIFYGRAKLFLGDFVKVVRGRQRLFTQRGLRRADWHRPVLDDTGADEPAAAEPTDGL